MQQKWSVERTLLPVNICIGILVCVLSYWSWKREVVYRPWASSLKARSWSGKNKFQLWSDLLAGSVCGAHNLRATRSLKTFPLAKMTVSGCYAMLFGSMAFSKLLKLLFWLLVQSLFPSHRRPQPLGEVISCSLLVMACSPSWLRNLWLPSLTVRQCQ